MAFGSRQIQPAFTPPPQLPGVIPGRSMGAASSPLMKLQAAAKAQGVDPRLIGQMLQMFQGGGEMPGWGGGDAGSFGGVGFGGDYDMGSGFGDFGNGGGEFGSSFDWSSLFGGGGSGGYGAAFDYGAF